MKYAQFLEFDKILNENNLTIDDIKENPEVLNEISIAGLIGGGLLGLATIFRKSLLRLGLKKYYLIKLKNHAEKFGKKLIEDAQEMSKNMLKGRQKINNIEQEFEERNDTSSSDYRTFQTQKIQYEKKMYDYGIKKISKQVEKKTEQVEKLIDESKRLKESQKLALKYYWDSLMPHVELPAMNIFIDKGIITNKNIIDHINSNFKKEKEQLTKKFNNFTNKVSGQENEDEEKDKEKNKEKIKQTVLKPDKL